MTHEQIIERLWELHTQAELAAPDPYLAEMVEALINDIRGGKE